MARKRVHDSGYCYKKGQTRSKILDPTSCEVGEQPEPTRQKINAHERQRRINELMEEISELNRCIKIKEQRLEQVTASRNFKMCDEVATEISELTSRQRELNTELARLQQKSKKAAEYQHRKNASLEVCSDNAGPAGEPNLSHSLPTPHMQGGQFMNLL